MAASVAWISVSPIKGLRLQERSEVQLTRDGVPGDRAFFLVDALGVMVSAKRLGCLVAVQCAYDEASTTLWLRFPSGETVTAPVELGVPEPVRFFGLGLSARSVLGPFSDALSEHCATPIRLMQTPANRPGIDRGRAGAVTVLSLASLERLASHAGLRGVDPRRFRMTLGVEGLEAHEEDSWVDRQLRVGDALVHVAGNVGRCAVTTRQPDTGVADLRTLDHLKAYRDDVTTTEPLPFGVYAEVTQPGRVRVGDAIALCEPELIRGRM